MIKFNPVQIGSAREEPTIENESNNITGNDNSITGNEGLLIIRTANEYIELAKSSPVPKMLVSEFWHESELSILFADTNMGKSIFAVQVGNSICTGKAIRGFKLEAEPQAVLYFDFEMSGKQLEKRYSVNYKNHFVFDDKFYRIELNPDFTSFEDFEKKLFESIEIAIQETGSSILIIDNLTYLKSQTTETSKEALPLMKKLKELKRKHNLSILVLAHTPKRCSSNPISRNDLAGSKQLANFADSIFAIGESSKDKSMRYIKQLKSRATEIMYDSNNVVVCELNQNGNFLGFDFLEFGHENEHLKILSDKEYSSIDSAIRELKDNEPQISDREIARRLETNPVKVGRVLKRMEL